MRSTTRLQEKGHHLFASNGRITLQLHEQAELESKPTVVGAIQPCWMPGLSRRRDSMLNRARLLERHGYRDQVRCHSGFRPRTRQAVRPTGIRKRSITNSSAMSEGCHLDSATRFDVEAARVALGPYPGGDVAHRWRRAQLLACPWSVGDTLGPSVAHTGSGYSAATDEACAGLSIQRWAPWKKRHQRDRYRRS